MLAGTFSEDLNRGIALQLGLVVAALAGWKVVTGKKIGIIGLLAAGGLVYLLTAKPTTSGGPVVNDLDELMRAS